MSSQHIADLLSLIDDEDLSRVLTGYSDTSEVNFFIECNGNKS